MNTMATERYLMANYKKFLLNRTTITPVIVECIESCLTNEEETTNQSFHKIMVCSCYLMEFGI